MNEKEDWTLASEHFGVKTYYRREPDESLSVKLEGEVKDAPLFEQVCVLREFDLHCKWSPFCTSSRTIRHIGKLDTVGWFMIGLPSFGVARDGCVRVIGCDSSLENGKVIIAGQGVRDVPPGGDLPEERILLDDPIMPTLDIPPGKYDHGSYHLRLSITQTTFMRTLIYLHPITRGSPKQERHREDDNSNVSGCH